MADISTKLKQLRSLYSKMPEGGGKQAVAQKIAKLEASQPKEVVEVKEEVKEEVIKKPKAPKKTSKGKEMRHVFEKKVDGGKEVKVVMATSVDLAKEAMQESGFDYNRTISRGRSPKEGFVASGKPKKIKETKVTKRPTKATRDEMAKAAGMTPEKAEKVAKKVSSAKKRGRKPAKHNSYLFEMPMKTQAGKVKRKVIVATSEESAQKQAGRNYTFIKELKAGEKPKTGIQSVKDFVAPPPKKRGRRPRPKTQAEMDRMSDLYSKLGKKVKGQKSKKSKVAKKPKAPKKTSKSADSSIEFTALKKLAEEVTDLTEQLSFRVQVLNGQIEKFRNYEIKYAKGGKIKKGSLVRFNDNQVKVNGFGEVIKIYDEDGKDIFEVLSTEGRTHFIAPSDKFSGRIALDGEDYAKGGKTDYKDEVEDAVRDLSAEEYQGFCYNYNIDPNDANEMSNFIADLDQDDAAEVMSEIRFNTNSEYAEGGEVKNTYTQFPNSPSRNKIPDDIVSVHELYPNYTNEDIDERLGDESLITAEIKDRWITKKEYDELREILLQYSASGYFSNTSSQGKRVKTDYIDINVSKENLDKLKNAIIEKTQVELIDIFYAKGGKTQKEHTFSYRIYDESGDEIDGGSIKMMGEDRETAYNKAVTSIEEGLNEGEEVEVSKGMDYKDRFKKGFAN